jgi:hypothetical protein
MPTSKDNLLEEYDQIEDQIEEAAKTDIWVLADWLAEHVPDINGKRKLSTRGESLTVEVLAERGRRGKAQLYNLRQVAVATKGNRMDGVSPRVYLEALRICKGDLERANDRLKTKGKRLRDQSGPMESIKALAKQIGKRSGDDKVEIIDGLLANADPDTVSKIYHAAKLVHHNGYVSPAEREAGKAHMEKNVTGPLRQAMGNITSLSVIDSLEDATTELKAMVSDGELTPQVYANILDADSKWRLELEVASAMFNMDDDIEEMAR